MSRQRSRKQSQSATPARASSCRPARLALEPLEDRNLLALMLDPTFTYPAGFTPGHVYVNHNGESPTMDIQDDGKIVMGGFTFNGLNGEQDFALLRLNPDGTPDPTFNADGNNDGLIVVSFNDFAAEVIHALAFQRINGEQRIVVAGSNTPPGTTTLAFAAMRFLPNGSIDTTFGCPAPGSCTGKVSIPFQTPGEPPSFAIAYAMAIQADNKILMAGVAHFTPGEPGRDFALARLTENGRLDRTFGQRGRVVFSANNQNEARSVILLPPDLVTGKQKILICGGDGSAPGVPGNFAIAQLESDGSLDSDEFASEASNPLKGIRLIDFSQGGNLHDDRAFDMVLQPTDGNGGFRIVVVGDTRWNPGTGDQFRDFALTRLLPNGDIDLSFGNHQPRDGKRTFHIGYEDIGAAVTLQPGPGANEYRIVIAGRSFFQTDPGTPAFMSGLRFATDAAEPDENVETFRSFFPNSIGHADGALAVKIANNKIIAAGFHTQEGGAGFGLIRVCDEPCGRGSDAAPSSSVAALISAVGDTPNMTPAQAVVDEPIVPVSEEPSRIVHASMPATEPSTISMAPIYYRPLIDGAGAFLAHVFFDGLFMGLEPQRLD
jgi:uncharacterized delta-60 repeat protein